MADNPEAPKEIQGPIGSDGAGGILVMTLEQAQVRMAEAAREDEEAETLATGDDDPGDLSDLPEIEKLFTEGTDE